MDDKDFKPAGADGHSPAEIPRITSDSCGRTCLIIPDDHDADDLEYQIQLARSRGFCIDLDNLWMMDPTDNGVIYYLTKETCLEKSFYHFDPTGCDCGECW
ncbi:hypothetical protein [Salininema proteolyticum]|uniref:Uncharacterized protein n=1 Tax=Salininema proteolyticum TaxID=1607685 RepID=A0ABV8TUJ8_9ACTN